MYKGWNDLEGPDEEQEIQTWHRVVTVCIVLGCILVVATSPAWIFN